MARETFRVHVTKDYLKFSAAHFIAYPGFRERLHGHNYRVSVEVEGALGPEGYVVDFGIVKRLAKEVCSRLDEKLLVPAASDCVLTEQGEGEVVLRTEGGRFVVPRDDCVLLPVAHTSAEELARFIAGELRSRLASIGAARIAALEVGVEETTGQTAFYRCGAGA